MIKIIFTRTFFCCLVSLAFAANAIPTIDSSKAAFFVGQEVMVCGQVSEIKPFNKGTHINLGSKFPSQHLTFVIWDSVEHDFKKRFGELSIFLGKQTCALGTIETYKDKLQIKVTNPQFLRLMK
jgi:DNA/RNA endonuclease YhcR with UshA esterase domain